MALNAGALTSQLRRVFDLRLEDISRVAYQIAQAYQSYARLAQAPPGVTVLLNGSEYRLLESELRNIMQGRLASVQAAQGIGRAVQSFWLTPPAKTGAGGVVTAVVSSVAVPRLASTNVRESGRAAQSLSLALDSITRTVFVTNSPPAPSGPLF